MHATRQRASMRASEVEGVKSYGRCLAPPVFFSLSTSSEVHDARRFLSNLMPDWSPTTYLRTYLQGARGALRRSSGSTRGPCARAYALQGTQPSANLSRSSCRLIDTWMSMKP